MKTVTFVTKHDCNLPQSGSVDENGNIAYEGVVQHPPEGCTVIYVNHTNFETKFQASEEDANKARSWLWRVIVEWNNKRLPKPVDPEQLAKKAAKKQNKIKVTKMEKGHAEWMEPDVDGHWHPREKEDKPRWKCPCGLVWTMKHDAEECTSRGHVAHYDMHYGGYVENGQFKGGIVYTIRAVRMDKPDSTFSKSL